MIQVKSIKSVYYTLFKIKATGVDQVLSGQQSDASPTNQPQGLAFGTKLHPYAQVGRPV